MIERILLFVEDAPGFRDAAAWALRLAQPLSARIFAVCVLPPGSARAGARRSELEEPAWQLLYEVEDDAFEGNVKISLLLEQGEPLERLCDLCQSYRVQLVCLSTDTRLGAAEVLRKCPQPVVFVRPPKEV
jgi:nucleotide-binding universal stress UspA family protein